MCRGKSAGSRIDAAVVPLQTWYPARVISRAMNHHKWMAATLLLASAFARADAELQTFVENTLTAARTRAGLPAVAALVQIDGKTEAHAAVGVRALGRADPVTPQDSWHLGSDAKAMTATLIARLVERGLLRYEDTMAKIFPGI